MKVEDRCSMVRKEGLESRREVQYRVRREGLQIFEERYSRESREGLESRRQVRRRIGEQERKKWWADV
jgi:hypothetical protein